MRQPLQLLILGEGDFSFACALAQIIHDNGLDIHLHVTELRSREQLLQTYGDRFRENARNLALFRFVNIRYGVDATNLTDSNLFQTRSKNWLVLWMAPYIPIGYRPIEDYQSSVAPLPGTPEYIARRNCVAEFNATVRNATGCSPQPCAQSPKQQARWSYQTDALKAVFNQLTQARTTHQLNMGVFLGLPTDPESVRHRFNKCNFTVDFNLQCVYTLNDLYQFRTTKGNPTGDDLHRGTFSGYYFGLKKLSKRLKRQKNTLFKACGFEKRHDSSAALQKYLLTPAEKPVAKTPPSTRRGRCTPSKYMGALFPDKSKSDRSPVARQLTFEETPSCPRLGTA